MWKYKERKERAKESLFSALLFYGLYCFSNGVDQGMDINDPKGTKPSRTKKYERCQKLIEDYIFEKWNK